MKRITLLIPLLSAAILLTACGKAAEPTEETVLDLEFQRTDGVFDEFTTYIETEDDIKIIATGNIRFVPVDGLDELTLVPVGDGFKERAKRLASFDTRPYTLYIPSDQVKDMSKDYAKLYQASLPKEKTEKRTEQRAETE